MVTEWLRAENVDSSSIDRGTAMPSSPIQKAERNLLLSKAETQSIWTVDLVMLLENLLRENTNATNNTQQQQQPGHHNNTSYLFCSEVLGVNTEHSTTGYYEKAFTKDSARVHKLCEEMNRLNLPLLCPYHMDFLHMIQLVSNPHCIAILLVDNHFLMKVNDVFDFDGDGQKKDTYMGHYVLVCGISRDPDHLVQAFTSDEDLATVEEELDSDPYCIALVNPGMPEPQMFVTPAKLEQAWRADGTDCDVIFVAKHVCVDKA